LHRFGHNKQIEAVKISSSKEHTQSNIKWEDIHYIAFDAPTIVSSTYQQRYQTLADLIAPLDHPILIVAGYVECMSMDHVNQILSDFRVMGAEGIILRNSHAPYINGYSHEMYKFKVGAL
jgi:ATP-dependent DNA ligase